MSQAASQAAKFYEEVASTRRVFTVVEGDDYLVFPVSGKEVIPFWSSASRVERVQKTHPKYRAFARQELSLDDFIQKALPQLDEEGISIGVNWSGKRLTGYDVSVPDLIRNIRYWQDKLKSSHT